LAGVLTELSAKDASVTPTPTPPTKKHAIATPGEEQTVFTIPYQPPSYHTLAWNHRVFGYRKYHRSRREKASSYTGTRLQTIFQQRVKKLT